MNSNLPIDPDTTAHKMLHVGGPNVGDRETFDRYVDQIFQRRWFTNGGTVVQEFEQRLCDYLNVKHCITVCNATIGLQLACHALGLTGEVIVPAFTFVATPHAVQWEGLKPVFADVDPVSHSIDPDHIESLINEKTSAILGVHLWGNPCDTDRIEQIAKHHQLSTIYDAAHAFGCAQGDRMIGNFGNCEVFSFHATKFFNTFEGGAIATNDDALAEKIRLMKNFGFEAMDRVVHLGTNAKMTEVCAAMGLSLFAKLEDLVSHNQHIYETYRQHLGGLNGLSLYSFDHLRHSNRQYVVLEIDEAEFGASRDWVMEHLHAQNIRARRYFFPGCHRMEPYRSRYDVRLAQLPKTERLCDRVLCLPTGGSVDDADAQRVCRVIKESRQLASQWRRNAAG
ncbi:MAG: DegT/DnrJ/EryC1/StrS family aminotransferase [Pirellulaceae bacterium]